MPASRQTVLPNACSVDERGRAAAVTGGRTHVTRERSHEAKPS
jgi:hypothetical protein